jgi:WD40 repeat protein
MIALLTMKTCCNVSIALLFLILHQTESFLSSVIVPRQSSEAYYYLTTKLRRSSDDSDDGSILESLKARQKELNYRSFISEQKWRNADCSSQIKVRLQNDFCRRLDVEYPLAAIGSTSGNIYIANLETGEILTHTAKEVSEDAMQSVDVCIQVERLRQLLHYGAGRVGTVAVAFSGDLICVSNPLEESSGVQVWRFDGTQLVCQGNIQGLDCAIVTCLKIAEDYLWVGTAKGNVYAYSLTEDLDSFPLTLQSQAELEWKFANSIISLSLEPSIGHGVVTTASGAVELISMEDDGKAGCSFYPPLNGKENIVSAILARITDTSYAIVCGGGDGSIWSQPLNLDSYGEILDEQPFLDPLTQLRPPHLGPVKCLANPLPGMLVSGGLDGSLRVWDMEEGASLYQFVGYKIWMGAIWTDGYRLVTDGSDNNVIVHDFLSEDNDSDL